MCGFLRPSWLLQALGLAVLWAARSPCQWSGHSIWKRCLALPHRTCRTATTSCRPRWRVCGHSCPRVGTASPMHSRMDVCSLDTAEQVGAKSWEVAVSLLGMVWAVGFYLPLLHRLPLVPGSSAGQAGFTAHQAHVTSRWSHALPTAACRRRASNPRLEVDTTPRAQREDRRARALPFE